MNFSEELKERREQVEAVIRQYLPEEKGYQESIFQSMNYSVLAGGKRLRPMLMQETYRLFGGSGSEIEPFMAAMEMIHSASLVHDDLPCMDNDRYRRGKLTTWAEFGEDMAVLAGDALILYAIETAAKASSMTNHPDRILRAVQILSEKSGIYGMIGGQTVDVEVSGGKISEEELEFIYLLKTAALLEASMHIGAVLAGADEQEQKAICQIAVNVGMAFQIQDDILDVTGDEAVIGKPVGSDEKNNKSTWVTLKGLETAKEAVQSYSQDALELLRGLKYKNEFLEQLIIMLITRDH